MKQNQSAFSGSPVLKLQNAIAEAYDRQDEPLLFSLSRKLDEIQLRLWGISRSCGALYAQE